MLGIIYILDTPFSSCQVGKSDTSKKLNRKLNLLSTPHAQLGSKISSRSSEHSIAKLMETLEATASATASASHHASTGGGGGHAIVPSNSVSMSLSGMAASTSAGSGGGNGGLHPGHPGDPSIMAQSMPATVMAHQLQVISSTG